MSVSMEPGATELTRMPCFANSSATAGDDDFRARFCKGQRRSFADTGGATGHKHYFVSIGVLHLNK